MYINTQTNTHIDVDIISCLHYVVFSGIIWLWWCTDSATW